LAALANNGGPTRTHALLPDSPAINRGDAAALPGEAGVPMSDQRGSPFTRVFGGRIDVGAFERQPTEFVLGDFNRDGAVDAADYVTWRRALDFSGGIALLVDSQGNGDGLADERDHSLWMSHFGMTKSDLGMGAAAEAVADDPAAVSEAPKLLRINPLQPASARLPMRPGVAERRVQVASTAREEALVAWVMEAAAAPEKRERDLPAVTRFDDGGYEPPFEPLDQAFEAFAPAVG
jgi:hypothetical protein